MSQGPQFRMNSPLRVGVIGCGRMGTFHARTLAEDPQTDLTYVFDTDSSRCRLIADRFQTRAVSEPSSAVDALVIASPSATHANYLKWGVASGLPMLVEKPITLTAETSAQFVGRSHVMVGHCERFNPAFVQAAPPQAGRVVVRRLAQHPGPTAQGDVVIDLMVHDLDLLLTLGGAVHRLDVQSFGKGTKGLEHVHVVLEMASGLHADVIASQDHNGSERSWEYPDERLRFDLHRGEAYADNLPLPRRGGQDALCRQWRAFRESLTGNKTAIATAADAHDAVVLAERIRSEALGLEYARAS